MQTLPSALRRYLCCVWSVAVVLACVCLLRFPLQGQHLPFTLLFGVLAVIAIVNPISYAKNYDQTVETALLIAAVFVLQPSSVALIVLVSFTVFGIYKKLAWYKTFFNVALGCSIFGSISLLIHASGLQSTILSGSAAGVFAAALVFAFYTVLSTSLMALVVAFANEQPVSSVWRETVKFFNAYDIALLPYGLLLAWLWQQGIGYFMIGLVPLAALQRLFAHHAGLLNEQRRTAELVDQQRRVHEAITVLLSGTTICQQINTLLVHITAVFPIERAGVVLWGDYGQPDVFITRDDPQLEQALRTWRAELLSLRNAPQMVRLDQECAACHIDALPLWLVPLATPSGALGSLVLVGERTWQVGPQQQRLVETFAGQAALAIDQSRMITRLHATRQQLIESERLAAIGGLAAGVAHEFNNLLSVLSGNVQVAAMAETDPAERQQLLHNVVQLALNGTSITDGLLRFGRREEPRREPANLTTLVDAVLTAIRNDCANARVEVVRDFDEVPPIVCEAGAISQVLINLLFNALDAIHPNAGTLTVRLKHCDPYVTIKIQDTGCGIPANILHTIFEPFMTTKAHKRNALHGGTGLGLSISHGIIANHGGSIEVASTEGHGSTFTIQLPVAPDRALVVDVPPMAAVPAPRLRVVVVDDEPAIAQGLSRMLIRDGYAATWFTTPEDAIAALQQEPADVVFADLRMPNMDGLALLDWVKQQDPHAERVLISAHIDRQHREQAGAQGIAAVIEKPFEFADVQRVLGTLASSA